MTSPDRAESSTATTRRTISHPISVKRERDEDQEENGRNTRQRSVAERAEPVNEVETVEKIVLDELWNADDETAWKSMKRLWKLLGDQGDNARKQKQQTFYQVGGHAFVVKLMNDHPNHRMIQHHGIGVIAMATCGRNECLFSAIAKVRGIEAILAAMKEFPANESIIHSGFTALLNITRTNKEHCDLLVTGDGQLPFLIERMKYFAQNRMIVDRFCTLLCILSRFTSTQLKSAIVEAGAITALGMALERHKNNESIQKLSRVAIHELTRG